MSWTERSTLCAPAEQASCRHCDSPRRSRAGKSFRGKARASFSAKRTDAVERKRKRLLGIRALAEVELVLKACL
jgi:hypothetical protein